MGWKSDWLYGLVFTQFQHAWMKAREEGEGRFGPASALIYVAQYNEAVADGIPPYCRGKAVRAWKYSGSGWDATAPAEIREEENVVHGMFYHSAVGRFSISEDRKTVIIEYIFGPRYGHGFVFAVKRQGKHALLLPKPDAVLWQS